jgi:hypothetical protein
MTPWQERRRDELRAWYSSHDAATWEKPRREIRTRVAPLLADIIGQGTREGVFATDRHGRAARLTVSLVQNLDERLAYLVLTQGAWSRRTGDRDVHERRGRPPRRPGRCGGAGRPATVALVVRARDGRGHGLTAR